MTNPVSKSQFHQSILYKEELKQATTQEYEVNNEIRSVKQQIYAEVICSFHDATGHLEADPLKHASLLLNQRILILVW